MKTLKVVFAVLLLASLLGWCIMRAAAAPLTSPFGSWAQTPVRTVTGQDGWRYARNAATTGYVTSDDADIEPNGMSWQDTGAFMPIPPEWNTVDLAFFGYGDGTGDGDANGGSFDVNVYVVEPYASWEHVASATATIGELELTHFPATCSSHDAGAAINSGSLDPNQSYKWAEGPFTDNLSDPNAWPGTIMLTGRTNGIGRIDIDRRGARAVYVRYDNIAGLTRLYCIAKGH